jgi:3',5'-cyclic AMP phosphodiesterase CpdA
VHNWNQYAVVQALDGVAKEVGGLHGGLLLGDNFYHSGVDGVDDAKWTARFMHLYDTEYLGALPFYAVLGNHDYGGEGLGVEFWKAQYEIDYTAYSDKWTMPDRYYTFTEEHVQFFGLDTNAILWAYSADQEEWLATEVPASTATWKIAYGHHPYVSNGTHGNAGAYDDIPDWLIGAEIPRGDYTKEFMENEICGVMDVYVCGHDHNRQWLVATCGTEFIVSGAGAKTTEDAERGNPTSFEEFDTEGFLWVEIADESFTGRFYDATGTLQFEQTITK